VAVTPLPYHVGVVVTNLEDASVRLTGLLGLRWCKIQRAPVRLDMNGELVTTEIEFVYSQDGAPHFELILQKPGTPWHSLGIHHLGLWADSFTVESERFEACGYRREAASLNDAGDWAGGVYFVDDNGLRLELCEISSSGPRFVRYLDGVQDYA